MDAALYSIDQIRRIEQAAVAALPPGALMQRAGAATAALASRLLAAKPSCTGGILVLVGPGNNGGDALEAAALLAHAGIAVCVCMPIAPSASDAAQALHRATQSPAMFLAGEANSAIASANYAVVIDGLFGIGLTRPIDGALRSLVENINNTHCTVLALDVPSGLNPDTGTVVGPNGIAVRATHTITFIGDKPGLHTCDGRDLAGEVTVANLDIGREHFPDPAAYLNHAGRFASSVRARLHNTHKGTYGDVTVIGGANGMSGAVLLAARAAAYCGAGRVFAAFVGTPPAYDTLHPELMLRAAHTVDCTDSTIVIGPGLGKSEHAQSLLKAAVAASVPLVLDADALNLLAEDNVLQQKLAKRRNTALITPHPLEAARLLGVTTGQIQRDRLASARMLAQRLQSVVVLKGSGTVIAAPDGSTLINTTGNPALATAGTGDVLSGVCGALLAQQWRALEAASGGVWLHGQAADTLVAEGFGPIGLTASELIPAIRRALNCAVTQLSSN